ncbi:MAG TPA: sulfurtransferase [Motilibacteraceae bacterium]|nr:sulfurtransferase [Motilibacteraceae bacterium]
MSRSEHVVDAAELTEALAGPTAPLLIDVRWSLAGPPGREAYLAGHLPGAVFVDLDTALAGPPGAGGRHPLPDPATFHAAMVHAGVRPDHDVVAYDGGDGLPAARCWWLLRHAGHRRVRVLDGGLPAWVAAGGVLEPGDVVPVPGEPLTGWGELPVVDVDGAAAAAGEGVLLDARAGERYRGEVEPVDPVAGHVPGAVSAPAVDDVDATGRLLDASALRERYTGLGALDAAAAGRPVVAMCGSGVTAARTVLALAVAGVDAALWPGSWSEWVADPSRPVAVGEGRG